jgi:ubiquinone/menaquinone biosynthesis C-methylase UbiE
MDAHRDLILDQFTRQAVPFASAAPIRNQEALDRIVRMADAGPSDTVLDVACGPGLLACAFARVVSHATGIDLTPAMLEQAREEQRARGLQNVSWRQGDVLHLPYPDAQFSIVSSRFAFHHLLQPKAVLAEMIRVCEPRGRIVVADSAPAAPRADAFNAVERLRDPSHVRAFPPEQLRAMFIELGLPEPRVETYRLEGELDDLLRRSFPDPGNEERIREIFERSLADDAIDMRAHRQAGTIRYGFPVAILAATVLPAS